MENKFSPILEDSSSGIHTSSSYLLASKIPIITYFYFSFKDTQLTSFNTRRERRAAGSRVGHKQKGYLTEYTSTPEVPPDSFLFDKLSIVILLKSSGSNLSSNFGQENKIFMLSGTEMSLPTFAIILLISNSPQTHEQ